MLKYRGPQLVRAGFMGAVLIALVVAVGLSPERLASWASSVRYQALFTDVGGLAAGSNVTVSGVKAGTVTAIRLHDTDALVTFSVNGSIPVGFGHHSSRPHRNPARTAGVDAGIDR